MCIRDRQVFDVAALNCQCYFCCCCFLLLWVPLIASPQKTREQVIRTRKLIAAMSPRENILVVIDWLDFYTVESAARYG